MKHSAVAVSFSMAMIIGLSGCGDGALPASTRLGAVDPSPNLGGDRLPVQQPGEDYGHQSVLLTGTIGLQDDGCWTIDLGDGARLVVLPPGYTMDSDNGSVMVGPDGTVVENAMVVDAVGGVVPVSLFPGVPDGYWGNYLTFCRPELQEFVVLDTLGPAFLPDELSSDQLVAILRDADLSQAWGCGVGFAVSSEDQHVALMIHLRDMSDDVEVPVSLPEERWVAEVVIGKHLMTQWCDDAIESWEPQRLAVASWALTGGELAFTPPSTAGCAAGVPVTATLTGIRVQTSTGEVELNDLNLVNDAYGCFAG